MITSKEKSKPMNYFTHTVYILTEQNEKYRQLLEQSQLPDLKITDSPHEATILLASPPLAAQRLADFPKLQWLQSIYAGVDALQKVKISQNCQVTNVKGIFGQQIAEYVLGNSIAFYRHFSTYQQQQQNKHWQPHSYESLNNKVMVILGTGSIACHLAKVAQVFGLEVIGINRSGIPPKDSPFSQVFHVQELKLALNNANILVNTLPATSETQDLIDIRILKECQDTVLFNVGRGSVLKEQELLHALDIGHIAHAFLDVFRHEPLKPEDVLWNHPNITVTPHIAALSFPEQAFEVFSENYLLWRDGFSLMHNVDLSKGY